MSDKLGDLDPAVDEELDATLAAWRRLIELELRVSAPAHIVTYDAVTGRATVALGALPVQLVEGEEVVLPPIQIPGVPVMWLGSATIYAAGGLVPGDTGLVVFADRAMGAWLLAGTPVDPINGRTHNLADAVFYPTPMSSGHTIPVPIAPGTFRVEAPQIQLGATAVQHVVLGELLHAYMLAMFTAAATAALDGGATFKAALIAYLGANPLTAYTSTKVTAE